MCFFRASDISRKKKQNFTGFSGVNSWKNRPISRKKKSKFAEKSANVAGFSREKVKIRGKIGRFRGILAEKSNISKDFRGKFIENLADFTGNFVKKQSVKNSQLRCFLGGKFR